MAVKIAPNAPHAAPVSGSANQMAPLRIMPGAKQYRTSATNPPASPYNLRATYQRDPPSRTPKPTNGARASQPQSGETADSVPGQTTNGAAAIRKYIAE